MDIVERLRGYIAYNTKQSSEEDDVMRDAAAEIERLRSEAEHILVETTDGTTRADLRAVLDHK